MLFENCKLLQRFLILIFNSKETKANSATAFKKKEIKLFYWLPSLTLFRTIFLRMSWPVVSAELKFSKQRQNSWSKTSDFTP